MTMKRRLLPRLVLGLALVVIPAAADAPPDQYEQFDRDTPEIHDLHTTLRWQRSVGPSPVTYAQAEIACQGFGGTLPTVKELLTIVDEEPHQEYEGRQIVSKMIDGQAFPSTPIGQPFWTLTPSGATKYWTVSFADGTTSTVDATGTAYVRCVK
jgi:hypothetical protein